jgi:glycine betaine/choline ABC-type transport system substrate-binding protein
VDGDAGGDVCQPRAALRRLILGQIAAQALEAAGADVRLTENLASPDGPRNALLADEIDAA